MKNFIKIKKMISILFFLSITVIGLCQNKMKASTKFKASGVFETGYENNRTTIYQPDSVMIYGILPMYEVKPFYGLLSLKAEWVGFEVYSSNKTYFNKDRSIYFNPLLSEFKIGFAYTYKKVRGGYEHLCSHNVSGKLFTNLYDRVYIRITLF